MKNRPSSDRFLGVRLDAEDLERLDRIVEERGFSNRSQAIRHILSEAAHGGEPRRAPGERTPRGRSVEVPVSLHRELERTVENGYSTSVEAALEKALERGLEEIIARRARRIDLERQTAERLSAEELARRKASQEGERRSGA